MAKAYLSLGSNQEPEWHLEAAANALRETFGNVVLSDWVQTKAVGFEGPDFINGAARPLLSRRCELFRFVLA